MENVVKFKKPFQFRIGSVIFGVLCLYLIVLIFTFVTHKRVSSYEVTIGDLSSYYSFHALAIRQEHLVKASQNGYITYLTKEDTKASAKSVVYALHSTNNFYRDLKQAADKKAADIDPEKKTELLEMLDDFTFSYKDSSFYDLYGFQDTLNGKIIETLAANSDTASFLPGMSAYYAYQAGIVLYEEDGLEGVNVNNFTPDQVNGTNYNKQIFANQQQIQTGDTVYKLVTDETWHLVVPLEAGLKQNLSDDSYIDVKFLQDNRTVTVPFKAVERQGKEYLVMELNSGLIRYAKSRYVDIDLMVNKTKGFKIPNSSIVKLPFIAIPKEYLMESKNEKGIMRVEEDGSGNGETTFVSTPVYASDDSYCYVRTKKLQIGDEIQIPGSVGTYKLSTTKKYPCVYCMNKGYSVVRIVRILKQNDDYSITEMNVPYSIRNFDHIVLDGSLMKEGEMIP